MSECKLCGHEINKECAVKRMFAQNFKNRGHQYPKSNNIVEGEHKCGYYKPKKGVENEV